MVILKKPVPIQERHNSLLDVSNPNSLLDVSDPQLAEFRDAHTEH